MIKPIAILLAVVLGIALIFAWFESRNEVAFFCNYSTTLENRKELMELLETGEFTQVAISPDASEVVLTSWFHANTTTCTISLQGDLIRDSVLR